MSAFLQKYKREAVLIAVSALAIYGLPLLYRLLPVGSILRGDHLLRIAAVIVFGTVVWYSFSVKRRFLPIVTVGVLSFGMRASLYGSDAVTAMSCSAAESVPVSGAGSWRMLLFIAAGACIGLLAGVIFRRIRAK